MYRNETDRAQNLNSLLLKCNFNPEDLAETEYPALTIHSNSTIFYANQAFCDLTQYTEGEIIGLNAWTLFPPKSIELITQKLKQNATEPYRVLARPRDGHLVDVEIKGKNFELAGELVRAVLVKKL